MNKRYTRCHRNYNREVCDRKKKRKEKRTKKETN